MANISSLGNLVSTDSLDLDDYKESTPTPFRMARAGRYTLRAPEFTDEAFTSTRENYLQARIDPTIVGPTNEGTQIRYSNVSAKTFERDGAQVSFAGLYLRACGHKGPIPGDPQALADLIASTSNQTYDAQLDWEANHRATGFKVKGMKNFPKGADGEYQSWVDHPTEKGADGQPLRVWANLVIKRFIAPGE